MTRRRGLATQPLALLLHLVEANVIHYGMTSQLQQPPADQPRSARSAQAQGATVYFVDEAGIRSDYHAGTTWAPVGQTPIVKATGALHSLNMISAGTTQGLLRFSTYTGSFSRHVHRVVQAPAARR
jgi:hypothetical protein